MEIYTEEEIKVIKAQKKVKKIKAFYVHLLIFVLVNLMIIFIKIRGDNHIKISQFFTVVIWGSIVLYQAVRLFLPNLFFSKNWEERKPKN